MGPLDQARIRSRNSPAGRPHPSKATNQRESTNGKRWASQETSQLWRTRFPKSSQPGKMTPLNSDQFNNQGGADGDGLDGRKGSLRLMSYRITV